MKQCLFANRVNEPESGDAMQRHVLSALVQNHTGVLSRVSGLFSRRGYNIESLTVGETTDTGLSRMTIVVRGDESTLEQIQKQLEKLVEVQAVQRLQNDAGLCRELALIKVDADKSKRSEVIRTAEIFDGRVLDASAECLTIEATGDHYKIDSIIQLLLPYGIRELARTGIAALERGSSSISLLVSII